MSQVDHLILLTRAMRDSDHWCCRIRYKDSKGAVTERVISPTCYLGEELLQAVCLGREEPRTFCINQIQSVELVPSHDVLMPEEIKQL